MSAPSSSLLVTPVGGCPADRPGMAQSSSLISPSATVCESSTPADRIDSGTTNRSGCSNTRIIRDLDVDVLHVVADREGDPSADR